jgi:hypothetical protein
VPCGSRILWCSPACERGVERYSRVVLRLGCSLGAGGRCWYGRNVVVGGCEQGTNESTGAVAGSALLVLPPSDVGTAADPSPNGSVGGWFVACALSGYFFAGAVALGVELTVIEMLP